MLEEILRVAPPVAIWLYAEQLTLVYRDEPLAQYRVAYQLEQCRQLTVKLELVFESALRSAQLPLRTWGENEWLPVLRLPADVATPYRRHAAAPLRAGGGQRLAPWGHRRANDRCHTRLQTCVQDVVTRRPTGRPAWRQRPDAPPDHLSKASKEPS